MGWANTKGNTCLRLSAWLLLLPAVLLVWKVVLALLRRNTYREVPLDENLLGI